MPPVFSRPRKKRAHDRRRRRRHRGGVSTPGRLVHNAAGRGRDIKIKTRHIKSNSRWLGWLKRESKKTTRPGSRRALKIYNKIARENCLPLKRVFFLAAVLLLLCAGPIDSRHRLILCASAAARTQL